MTRTGLFILILKKLQVNNLQDYKHSLNRHQRGTETEVSDDHDVLLLVVPVRQPLIPDLDLGEVKAAGLGAGAAAGDGADGQAVPEEGAVDLPGPQARAKAPDVLKYSVNQSMNLEQGLAIYRRPIITNNSGPCGLISLIS